MLRLSALFVVGCMVLIAASAGVVLYLVFGMGGAEATLVALVALSGLALYNAVTTRLRDRADLGGQIADLSRGTADLARQVAELGRRTAALEGHGDKVAEGAAERTRKVTEPVAAELSELGTLVKQLAETVAVHEGKLAAAATRPDMAAEAAGDGIAGLGEPEARCAADAHRAIRDRDELAAVIRNAIEANRVDLYLQPIVTLPQRKVRYYEALTRLRTGDGQVLQPADFLGPAEAADLMPRIDNLLLLRCVQVMRRLQVKNRDIGLFCNIALGTLKDPRGFLQLSQFLDANRALAPQLVLEFKQSAWHAMGPFEQESLAVLREQGFRFCMGQVTDLRMEPRDLAERGICFVKVSAPLLLGRAAALSPDIHAADLSDLLARSAISLIADHIEAESQVVDLLDYDVRFGQGFLFSPPRPVRADALQGATERVEAPVRLPPESPRDKPSAAHSSAGAVH